MDKTAQAKRAAAVARAVQAKIDAYTAKVAAARNVPVTPIPAAHTCGHPHAVWPVRDSSGIQGKACRACAGKADFEISFA